MRNGFKEHREAQQAGDDYRAGVLESEEAEEMARNLPRWYLEELAERPSNDLASQAARLALATKAHLIRDACDGQAR